MLRNRPDYCTRVQSVCNCITPSGTGGADPLVTLVVPMACGLCQLHEDVPGEVEVWTSCQNRNRILA